MNSKIIFFSLLSFVSINLNGMDATPASGTVSLSPEMQQVTLAQIKEFYDKNNPELNPAMRTHLAEMVNNNPNLKRGFYLRLKFSQLKISPYTLPIFDLIHGLCSHNWGGVDQPLLYSPPSSPSFDFSKTKFFVEGLMTIALNNPPVLSRSENSEHATCAENRVNLIIKSLTSLIKSDRSNITIPASVSIVPQNQVSYFGKISLGYKVSFGSNCYTINWWHEKNTVEFIKLLMFIKKNYHGLMAGINERLDAENKEETSQQITNEFNEYLKTNGTHFAAANPQESIYSSEKFNVARPSLDECKYQATIFLKTLDDYDAHHRKSEVDRHQNQYTSELSKLTESFAEFRNKNFVYRWFNIVGEVLGVNTARTLLARQVIAARNKTLLANLASTNGHDPSYPHAINKLKQSEFSPSIERKLYWSPSLLTETDLRTISSPLPK